MTKNLLAVFSRLLSVSLSPPRKRRQAIRLNFHFREIPRLCSRITFSRPLRCRFCRNRANADPSVSHCVSSSVWTAYMFSCPQGLRLNMPTCCA